MIFLTLENPRAGCKKRTSLFRITKALCHYNSTEYTENILIKKYGLPELLPIPTCYIAKGTGLQVKGGGGKEVEPVVSYCFSVGI